VAGAAAGVLLLYTLSQGVDRNRAAVGLRLFVGLHEMLLLLICVLVPAMSADCIARENREGTLGLLFLTPLTPMGIVWGKGLVQLFRAFTLWLAVLPVLIIPFLSGGVTGGDVFSAMTLEFCATVLCLAAGILASSLAKSRTAAYMLAALLGVTFLCVFAGALSLGFLRPVLAPGQRLSFDELKETGSSLLVGQSGGGFPMLNPGIIGISPGTAPTMINLGGGGFGSGSVVRTVTSANGTAYTYSTTYTTNSTSYTVIHPAQQSVGIIFSSAPGWNAYFSSPASGGVWGSLLLQSLMAVPLLFFIILCFAARQIATSWHDKVPPPRRQYWIKTYCMPLAQRRFAKRMQETLDWNPIAWLQQYSWQSRVSKWGLCLILLLIECCLTNGDADDMLNAQTLMIMVLAAAFTFIAISGFLTEKKNGALELLLVTPISPSQIISGRVYGLWKQFLPAGLTLLFLWQFAHYLVSTTSGWRLDQSGLVWRLLTSPMRGISWGDVHLINSSNWFQPSSHRDSGLHLIVAGCGFLALPVFATYFALRVKNLIVAAALTWVALFLCPYAAFSALASVSGLLGGYLPTEVLCLGVIMANLGFASLTFFLLNHSLSRRIYSF